MKRKRLTQRFPWLIPIRVKQRKFCYYLAMRWDGRRYCGTQAADRLPVLLFESSCPMYNAETGFDMVFQKNKVFNLQLAAMALDTLLIRPGETFSLSRAIRHADRKTPYRDGLTVIDGKLTTAYGGGLCQISNLLFWLFLHSPLTLVERHGHGLKEFPEPPSDAPIGVDATISEGWLDLKVQNDTAQTYQIGIGFDDVHITGRLYTDRDMGVRYEIANGEILYYRLQGRVYEETDILQRQISKATGDCVATCTLYRNKCEIGYPLPEHTPVLEKG